MSPWEIKAENSHHIDKIYDPFLLSLEKIVPVILFKNKGLYIPCFTLTFFILPLIYFIFRTRLAYKLRLINDSYNYHLH